MDTYICEKPSQGADLAKVLAQGKPVSKQKGCIYGSNNSWCVTWGVGHLLELPKPEEFDPERWGSWTLASLPIMPETWRWKVNSRTADQFKLVKEILKKTKTAYIATDFGREGEAIGRSLLDECKFKGQVRRVVLRSLDPKSIEKALSSILGGEATIPLYHSALSRSRADYLVGMNLTRLYTVLGQMIGYKETLNIGRVLTPIVNLVVERDLAIKTFVKSPYWTLNTTVTTASGSFIAKWQPEAHCDSEGRCVNAQHAQTIQRALTNATGTIEGAAYEHESEVAPLPFDLTSLQQYANKRWGYTAEQVLGIAQALYETHKVTTYPRTDSRYIPEEQRDDVAQIFTTLASVNPEYAALVNAADALADSRVFNTKKVVEHHAIIPTNNPANLASLSEEEKHIFDAVCRFYIAQFMPVHEYLQTKISVRVNAALLTASGRTPLIAGWKSAFTSAEAIAPKDEEDEADDQSTDNQGSLPRLTTGQACTSSNASLSEKSTAPPRNFTEASLLGAMENISRFVTDERFKKILNETSGIGTPATRAGIIAGAVERNFLTRKGRKLLATEKAFALMSILPAAIKSPSMTAAWEQDLGRVAAGEMSMDAFMVKITQWISTVTNQLCSMSTELTKKDGLLWTAFANAKPPTVDCPLCAAEMHRIKGSNGYFWACQAEKDKCGKTFNDVKGKPDLGAKASTAGVTGSAKEKDAPFCDECGKPMVLRKGKPNGAKRASSFWSCSGYPTCKCTMPVKKK